MRHHAAALFLLVASAASAAPKSPVQWSIKSGPASAKAGATIALTLAGQIDPGWHLYALEEPDGGPIATVVGLTDGDPADLLNVTESKPILLNDPLFNLQTGFFRSKVNFILHLRVYRAANPGPSPLHILVRFQSCNDRVCLPPHTDTVGVPFTVVR
jgi:DsbC/DsbD-like thiol-disulfide interchange protein